MQQQPELQGLLDPSLYSYADQPEFITVRRHDLELCLRATISTVICEGSDITVLARDCMRALDGLANGTNQRVLALTAENEELRLKLFRKDHNHDSLEDLLFIT